MSPAERKSEVQARKRWGPAAESLVDQCEVLGIDVRIDSVSRGRIAVRGPSGEAIEVQLEGSPYAMLEQVLRGLAFRFADLPLLTVGESKEIRLLTPRIALAKLLPTVYSFTNQRYGEAPGTEVVRARFSAEIFRTMAQAPASSHLATAFLGLIENGDGPLLAEHVVEPGNLEVRVKRYHVGSPTHRYKYADLHRTAHGGQPLERWDRFERPVVCFDWRHPVADEKGIPLADEPLPDDYAGIWMDDVPGAKRLARDTFEWMEELFEARGLKLIDICYFIDATGRVIFGEISPDCMRVRSHASDDSAALDKDEWRSGGDAGTVLERYRRLYQRVFETHSTEKLAA
jgi:phosphoribosylaminoimidazole-succinocarboxamide synthase